MPAQALTAIEQAREDLCINRGRLYAVGDEAGSRVASRLACTIPVSAYAVTWDGTSFVCDHVVDTPRIRLYGERDKNQPPQGGWGCNVVAGEFASAANIEKRWKRVMGCRGKRGVWREFSGGTCATWKCARGKFVHCATTASHQWPGTVPPYQIPSCEVEPSPTPFPFAEAMWRFFDEEGLNVAAD